MELGSDWHVAIGTGSVKTGSKTSHTAWQAPNWVLGSRQGAPVVTVFRVPSSRKRSSSERRPSGRVREARR